METTRWVWSEWETVPLPSTDLTDALGEAVYRQYSRQVQVTFPSQQTNGAWEFRPQGWVGVLPLGPHQILCIQPKAPIQNVFRMWSRVHHSKDLRFLEGLVTTSSDESFTGPLVQLLVDLVQKRLQQGLYRSYLERHCRRTILAGRLDIPKLIAMPWRADLPCKINEQTSDLPDNQILAWTFHQLSRTSLGQIELQRLVRKVHRDLSGATSLLPFGPSDCQGRSYHRLNEDYELLHTLCGFFLGGTSPEHRLGEHLMQAFLVDMAALFEGFVAAWLENHPPPGHYLRKKVALPFGGYVADMVLFDRASDQPVMVLDAKYKCVAAPSSEDVHQVRSYAQAFNCTDAVLIYPMAPKQTLDQHHTIRTRSAVFRLDQSLDAAGKSLVESLLPVLEPCTGQTA